MNKRFHRNLFAVLLAVFLAQGAIVAVSSVVVGNRSEDTLAKLESIDKRITNESVAALANMLQTHLGAVEAVTDDSLYNAAMALQKLDTHGELGLSDLNALLETLEADALYLTDMQGNFTLSTVPQAGGLNLFDIDADYRALLVGTTKRVESTIKVMVETGEIYKFMAIPRLDEKGRVKGVIESAVKAESIVRQIEGILGRYPYIQSFHLFDPEKVCLMSIATGDAATRFVQTQTYTVEQISRVFADGKPIIEIAEDSVTCWHLVTRDAFGVGSSYVMRFAIEGNYYNQNTRETAAALGIIQKNFVAGMLAVFSIGALVVIAVVLFVLRVFHKRKIDEYRTQLMLSQIQPHFLYNSLTSISDLCQENPEAQQALLAFSEYLRANMSSLSHNRPVPFEAELKHVRHYLWLEKLRFEEKLTIEYDIATTNGMLPALTLQPIVENAVVHGLMVKAAGGRLIIRTEEDEAAFRVAVIDDGAGFDPERMPSHTPPNAQDDGREHIGIANVRFRLAALCGGTLRIHSVQGEGTVVTIEVPKGVIL